MIKIELTEVVGWNAAIRGMRNPMNSWDKSDSKEGVIGENDLKLMKNLSKAGKDHAKFRRMIIVYADITAPLYWWKEYDTYKVGTVANSCSTMHKIGSKAFTKEDFSLDHVGVTFTDEDGDEVFLNYWTDGVVPHILDGLNTARWRWLHETDPAIKKQFWWNMIQLLPSSYNQKRTIMLSYEVLANIYKSRKNHKLDEWHAFCDWIESLPYAEGIIF